MKPQKLWRNLSAYCCVKEASVKKDHTARFQLCKTLEKVKYRDSNKGGGCQRVGDRERRDEQGKQRGLLEGNLFCDIAMVDTWHYASAKHPDTV